MASTTETIILDTKQWDSAADAAAASVEAVAAALDKVKASYKGTTDGANSWNDAVNKATKQGANFGIKTGTGLGKIKKEQTAINRLMKSFGGPDNLRSLDGIKTGLGGIGKEFGAVGKAAGVAGAALVGVGVAIGIFAGIGAAIKAVAEPLLKAAGNATIARDGFRAMLDQVTGGRGAEALKVLDKLAEGLNMPVKEVTEQFVALRKEGINNISSEKLIKLRADLLAVGVDAGTADKAIDNVKKTIKAGLDPDKAILKVADHFGAMGDGANASADSVFTLEGALKRAGLVGERMIGKLADKMGPTFDRAAVSVAKFFDKIESGGKSTKLIDAIASGLDAVVVAGEAFLSAIGPGIDMLVDSFTELGEAVGATAGESGTAEAAGQGLAVMFNAVAGAVSFAIDAVTLGVQAFSLFSRGVRAIRDTLSGIVGAISSFSLVDAATNLVMSFINGLKAMAQGAVDAAKQMGADVVGALKGSLGISSPSKVGMALGQNFGDSFTTALDDSMPDDIAMTTPTNDNGLPQLDFGGGGGAAGGGPISINVEVVVTQSNASPDDIAAATQRGIEQGLRLAGVA